jgi:hypothetical protein
MYIDGTVEEIEAQECLEMGQHNGCRVRTRFGLDQMFRELTGATEPVTDSAEQNVDVLACP